MGSLTVARGEASSVVGGKQKPSRTAKLAHKYRFSAQRRPNKTSADDDDCWHRHKCSVMFL